MRTARIACLIRTRQHRLVGVAVLTAALVGSLAVPAAAAYRPGAAAGDPSGDVKVVAGAPAARQKTMTDVSRIGIDWDRLTPDQSYLTVAYQHKHRTGSGPELYDFRTDVTLTYLTRDGASHRAQLTVDPSDTTGIGFGGRMTMTGPHVADAEAAGERCSPSWSAGIAIGSYSDMQISTSVACYGDLAKVTGARLSLTTRHNGAQVSDSATVGTVAAAPPAMSAWRHRAVKDRAGDAGYSSRRMSKFADVLGLTSTYLPSSDRVRMRVKFAALSSTARQPRQRLTFSVPAPERHKSATVFVPGSAGRAGSFTIEQCDGEKMTVQRRLQTVTLTFPASCVIDESFDVWVWSNTLFQGQVDSSDSVGDPQGITLF